MKTYLWKYNNKYNKKKVNLSFVFTNKDLFYQQGIIKVSN